VAEKINHGNITLSAKKTKKAVAAVPKMKFHLGIRTLPHLLHASGLLK